MSLPERDLLQSVEEFRDTLRRVPVVGVSQIAEEAYLRVLVHRYPDLARIFIGEVDGPPAVET